MTYATEFLEMIHAGWGFSEPFGMYAPRLVEPPPGSDLIEEWELFYALAQRMDLKLTLQPINDVANSCRREPRASFDLDMSRKPTTEEVFELLTRGSRIPLEEVKKYPRGALFPESILAAPKDPQCTARLDVGNAEMMAELSAVYAKPAVEAGEFPYLLIGRRMAHVYNSSGRDLPMLVAPSYVSLLKV
jgi:hypothetical protein